MVGVMFFNKYLRRINVHIRGAYFRDVSGVRRGSDAGIVTDEDFRNVRKEALGYA